MGETDIDARIDEFVARSRELTGQVIAERPQWNTVASADAVRHFCSGVGDDNPRWGREAPPMFLTSVLYPMLHGAPISIPMSSLIGRLAYEWHNPIVLGAEITATATQTGVREATDREGRRLVLIDAGVSYASTGDPGHRYGTASSTMVFVARSGAPLLVDRQPSPHPAALLEAVRAELLHEPRRCDELFDPSDLVVGERLPRLVVGPLTVGDLICWQSAIGPSYRSGPLGLRDVVDSPHTATTNPAIGWPVKYSQQHEDVNLASQRGMPAPFDNGAMRMSQMSRQLTNWMGDHGTLRRLDLEMTDPVLYGDITWFDASITSSDIDDSGRLVRISIVGTNHLGLVNTRGTAEVALTNEAIRPTITSLPPRRSRTLMSGGVTDVAARIADIARAEPTRPALHGANGTLTYGDLVERARSIAAALGQLGIGHGDTVAMAVERAAIPVAALGILMAGGAYCPVDPSMPHRRLALLLDVATPKAIVGSEEVADAIGLAGLEAVSPKVSSTSSDRFAVTTGPAYVIQTSGSQGTPKTVRVDRDALSRYVAALGQTLDITPDDRYLLSASPLFSAASRQLWLPLTTRASIVVADDEDLRDPLALFATMQQLEATVWDTVPSLWAQACTALESLPADRRRAAVPTTLRQVLTTGEPLPWSTPSRWRRIVGDGHRLVNLYSQTETAGTVCTHLVGEEHRTGGIVPIGTPMPDVDVHLIDGEIVVESDRLATGYLDDPALSAQRFTDVDGRRVYRTGDLGHQVGDVLEIDGRADARLKVRGYRVDPLEVEAALERQPGIDRALVGVEAGPTGARQLTARLELAAAGTPNTDTLRRALADDLPEYAIPTSYTAVDRLPTTPSGKLDRSRADTRSGSRLGPSTDHREPSTPTERTLADIFGQVLGLAPVGADDDFVDLGGQSLAAIELVARVRAEMDVGIDVATVFEHPTVTRLAAAIDQRPVDRPGHGLGTVDRNGPLRASPMQEALFVIQQLHPRTEFNNLHWVVDLTGPLAPDLLRRVIPALSERHEALRTRFDFVGAELHQVIDESSPVELELVDMTERPEPERRSDVLRAAQQMAHVSFDLRTGPLWSAALIREREDAHVLVITAHHGIVDLHSVAIMIRDLLMLYAMERGGSDQLPPVHAQLADFVDWEHRVTATDEHRRNLRTRAHDLADAPPIGLAGDVGPEDRSVRDAHAVMGVVPADLTAALRSLAREQHRVTLFVTALAGFVACLRSRTGQDDLVIGCPFARRDRAELRDTVGMLVNTLPIRTDLSGAESFDDVVRATSAAVRDALACVDLAYADLTAAMRAGPGQPAKDPVEVLFQVRDDPLAGVGPSDLQVERVDLEGTMTAFPLQVTVRDDGDQLHVTLLASQGVYTRAGLQRLLDAYLTILATMASQNRHEGDQA